MLGVVQCIHNLDVRTALSHLYCNSPVHRAHCNELEADLPHLLSRETSTKTPSEVHCPASCIILEALVSTFNVSCNRNPGGKAGKADLARVPALTCSLAKSLQVGTCIDSRQSFLLVASSDHSLKTHPPYVSLPLHLTPTRLSTNLSR